MTTPAPWRARAVCLRQPQRNADERASLKYYYATGNGGTLPIQDERANLEPTHEDR